MTLTALPAITTTKVEAKAAELHAALTAVVPFAGTDQTIPMLNALRLEGDATTGKLTVVATDRYVLGTYVIPYEGPSFTVNVALRDVKAALTLIKASINKFVPTLPAYIEVNEDWVSFHTWDGNLKFRKADDDYPKWRGLIPTPQTGTLGLPGGEIGFNPIYMARFKGIGDKAEPMRMTMFGPLKPAVVKVGESFVGIIMPMRIATKEN